VEPQVSKVLEIQRLRTRGEIIMPKLKFDDIRFGRQRTDRNLDKVEQIFDMIDLQGETCLDIGFSYGVFTKIFLERIGEAGKVYAWEPNKFLFDHFAKKWSVFRNLTIYGYALSDSEGSKPFYVYDDEGMNSTMNSLVEDKTIYTNRQVDLQRVDTVQTKTLDQWWNQNRNPDVDFIKIDSEGHDLDILFGAKEMLGATKPDHIFIEQDGPEVIEFLEGMGYSKENDMNKIGLDDIIWKYDPTLKIQSKKGGIE